MNNKLFLSVVSIFLIVLTFFIVVLAIKNIKSLNDTDYYNTFSVSATGESFAKPDIAVLYFSIRSENEKTEEAMKENTRKSNNVIDFLKRESIEDKDIKTSSLNVYPVYNNNPVIYYENKEESSVENRIIGYEVTHYMEVKIKDTEKVGNIIDGIIEMGANQVNNLVFLVENEEELKEIARKEAIELAKSKAEMIAGELGVKIKRIVSFSEDNYQPLYGMGMGGGAPTTMERSTDIAAGENKITSTVNITFEISR